MPCCSAQLAMAKCSEGDSEKEPFIAAHNVILSHAAAVDIHRTKCQVLRYCFQHHNLRILKTDNKETMITPNKQTKKL